MNNIINLWRANKQKEREIASFSDAIRSGFITGPALG